MVDLAEIQTAYYFISAVGVIGTLMTAIIGVRGYLNSNKRAEEAKKKDQETQELALKAQQQNLETRQAQLFMVMYEKWQSPDFIESNTMIQGIEVRDFAHFQKIYDSVEGRGIIREAVFFEGLGVLVREGLIDVRLVSLFLYGEVKLFWEKWGPFMREQRIVANYPRAWIEAEYLYDRVMDYGRSNLKQV